MEMAFQQIPEVVAIAGQFLLKVLIIVVQGYVVFRVLKTLSIVLRTIYQHFILRPMDLKPFQQKWTVVTGGTDGIGLAYTEELARSRGLRKFFLVGRSQKKLESVATRLRDQFSCEVLTHVFDFESNDYTALAKELESLGEIGILVNCAGMAANRVAGFPEQPEGLSTKILQVNLMSAVRMIELILPGMLERKHGIIVNFSSVCGWRPYPYMSTYPASKAGLSFFSSSLNDELQGSGVRIQCVVPSLVATKMASYDTADANNVFVVDPIVYARQAVRRIGNCFLTTGCLQHDIQVAAGQLIGFWLFKTLFVPIGMLRVHKTRVDRFQERQRNKQEVSPTSDYRPTNGSAMVTNGGSQKQPLLVKNGSAKLVAVETSNGTAA